MAELFVSLARRYVERSQGPLSRLSLGTRLSILFFISVAVIVFDRMVVLEALAVASVLMFVLCRPSSRKILAVVGLVAATVWSIVFSQALFYQGTPRTAILELVPSSTPVIGWLTGGVYIYYEGIVYGLKQSIRAVATIFMGAAVVSSTSSTEIYQLLSAHPRLLTATLVALRGLEKLLNEISDAIAMLKLSGERVGCMKLYGFIPLITKRIEDVSISATLVLSYANPTLPRGNDTTHRFSVAALSIVAITIILLTLYALLQLYKAGLIWTPILEELYDILRLWFVG